MPYLLIQTNQNLSQDQGKALLEAASRRVAELLGKPERYVMVLKSGRAMSFGGSGARTGGPSR